MIYSKEIDLIPLFGNRNKEGSTLKFLEHFLFTKVAQLLGQSLKVEKIFLEEFVSFQRSGKLIKIRLFKLGLRWKKENEKTNLT